MTYRLLSLFAVVAVVACSKDDACSCFNPGGVAIAAPKGEVTAIRGAGAACADVVATCLDVAHDPTVFVAGCTDYVVGARQVGACEVHVETATLGSKDLVRTIADRKDDCCGGLYVTPESETRITLGP